MGLQGATRAQSEQHQSGAASRNVSVSVPLGRTVVPTGAYQLVQVHRVSEGVCVVSAMHPLAYAVYSSRQLTLRL